MNFGRYLINVVEKRASSLESEILLFDSQIPLVSFSPGSSSNDKIQLVLQRNIKATLYTILRYYIRKMEKMCGNYSSFQQTISCHLYVFKKNKFQILLQELYGQQSALTTLVGSDYQRFTNDNDVPADIHLKMIVLVFPFEFVVDLLSNMDFMKKFLMTVLDYNPKNHIKYVSIIFNMIRNFKTLANITNTIRFFTAKNPMYFMLAEHFITLFVKDKMFKIDWDPLKNFSTQEKCKLIAKHGMIACDLNQKLIDKVKLAALEKERNDNEEIYLRPYEKTKEEEFEADMEIPELKHIILELRKIPLQTSPSAMLYVLSNALQWLTSVLTVDGEYIGADEIFQFFVFVLAMAKLNCLDGLISYIDTFVDDALRETKFEYYIEQLRSGKEFIDDRLIPEQSYILFPFATVPEKYNGVLKIVENETVSLKGFAIYAFPTWNTNFDDSFPAMLKYNGSNDTVKCYKYEYDKNSKFFSEGNNFLKIVTLQGCFLQLADHIINQQWMIKVNNGDYEKSIEDIETLSCLILMNTKIVPHPDTSMIKQLYDLNKEEWKMKSKNSMIGTHTLIAEIQRQLVLSDLEINIEINGILNRKTLNAIRLYLGFNEKTEFSLTPRLFDSILSGQRSLFIF